MILDAGEQLASALAVTDTDAYTTYSKDFGNVTPKRNVGTGEPLCIVFVVVVAAAGSTDTTDLILVQSANASLASEDQLIKRRIANASLTAGSIWPIDIPQGYPTKRYLGGRVELGTGDTLTVDCYLLPRSAVDGFKQYYAPGTVIA